MTRCQKIRLQWLSSGKPGSAGQLSRNCQLSGLTYLEGNTVSSVARQYGISPAMLFAWRSKAKKGLLTSGHSAGKKTVPATQYAQALDEIQRLQKLLGRAVSDNGHLKEAVEMMSGKNSMRAELDTGRASDLGGFQGAWFGALKSRDLVSPERKLD